MEAGGRGGRGYAGRALCVITVGRECFIIFKRRSIEYKIGLRSKSNQEDLFNKIFSGSQDFFVQGV